MMSNPYAPGAGSGADPHGSRTSANQPWQQGGFYPQAPQSGYYPPPPQSGNYLGMYPPQPPVNPEKNGFGLTALILAVVGLVFGIVPFTGFICLILGLVGLIFAIAGLSRVGKNKATNKKTAITGLIVSILAIALGIWGIVIVMTAANDLGNSLTCISNSSTTAQMNACQ